MGTAVLLQALTAASARLSSRRLPNALERATPGLTQTGRVVDHKTSSEDLNDVCLI